MNKQLMTELNKMDDVQFIMLEHRIHFARRVRNTMKDNAIDEKTMATILGVSKQKMNNVLNGSYPYDLRFIAKLQAIDTKYAEEAARREIEERVQFGGYKFSKSRFEKKMDEIISRLETISPTPNL